MSYSVDLRTRVIDAVSDKMRITEAAKVFKVSRKNIYNWLRLKRQTNSLEPKTGFQKGHSHKIKDLEQFKKFVESYKHLTTKKMAIKWQELTGIKVSDDTILKHLKKIGYTFKKKLLIIKKPTKLSVKRF